MSGDGATAATRVLAGAAAGSPVRRNILLLAAGMAALYGMVELTTAVATLTFVAVGGRPGLAGSAPALFLAAAAVAAMPAGRAMDRFGRVPVLAAGFAAGSGGSAAAAGGVFWGSMPAVVLGFLLVGASMGTVMLSRAAAADMYRSDQRARAIGVVLFGAVFGAILGPAVFIPLITSAGGVENSSLALAWLGAGGFTLVGLALMIGVRPDPQKIARELAEEGPGEEPDPESMARIVRRPGIPSALVAAVASWSAMVALMTLSGGALVAHGHDTTAIFPVLAAHFVGMFGLFLVVGRVIERVGRGRALIGGLILLGASALGLIGAVQSVPLAAVCLFGIGLGWSLTYVAATTELAEHSAPAERGKVLGFADLVSGVAGAGLTLVGGIALVHLGIGALGVGAASVALLAGLSLLVLQMPRPA